MIQNKTTKLILLFLALSINLIAQEEYKNPHQEVIKLITASKKLYSIDDEVINGYAYPVPDRKIEGNPYLNEDQWMEGTIFVKGKMYANLFIKYDLILDDIILKAKNEDGVDILLSVNKSQVDSFLIGDSFFINSSMLPLNQEKQTYYEQIYRGNYFLLKKYKKIFIAMYNELTPRGKYSDIKNDIYLLRSKTLIAVNRKSSFINFFEKEKQKKIGKYMKSNKIKYQKASTQQLNELMKYCTNIISN